jgi:hypothetical protein
LGTNDKFVNFLAEGDAANRHSIIRRLGKRKFLQLALVEPGDVADFIDVMVFSGHPENRDGGNSFLRKFVSSLDSTESFVKGIRGTAKQPHLLAADNGDCPGGKTIQVFLGFGTAAKELVLGTEDTRYLGTAVGGELQFFGTTRGGFQIRRVAIEGLESGEMLNEVAE